MALEFREEADGRILIVQARGKLEKEDYKRFAPEVERLLRIHPKIDILFDMHDFHGWALGALWDDIKFDARHFNNIGRLAMVGERKWQEWMATFCKPFTTAEIRYFEQAEINDARAWIRS